MARPKKDGVDYFPHDVTHGDTMTIVEQKYGNDGYSFWFKLLEMIGKKPGHVLDCKNPATWEFLQAKTRLSEDICNNILDLLSRLDAIDRELWDNKRLIWSDNFVQRVADVYKNRKIDLPKKPLLIIDIPTRGNFYEEKPRQEGISTDENPQSKVKQSKEDISIVETPENNSDSKPKKGQNNARVKPDIDYDSEIAKQLSEYDEDLRLTVKSFISVVASRNKTGEISQSRYLSLLCELSAVSTTTSKELFRAALLKAIKNEAGTVNYIKAILSAESSSGNNGSSSPMQKPMDIPEYANKRYVLHGKLVSTDGGSGIFVTPETLMQRLGLDESECLIDNDRAPLSSKGIDLSRYIHLYPPADGIYDLQRLIKQART